jgi:hypothetical protein
MKTPVCPDGIPENRVPNEPVVQSARTAQETGRREQQKGRRRQERNDDAHDAEGKRDNARNQEKLFFHGTNITGCGGVKKWSLILFDC